MQGRDIFKTRRIVVLGSRAAGKSALVVQYVEGHFVEGYYPTVETTHTKTIQSNGVDYDCDIIDTAGQDQFSILNTKYAVGIHGYLLVYSVASLSSFEMVEIMHAKIIDLWGTQKVPVVIVAQKTDLPVRQVSMSMAQTLAEKLGCAYIESSARQDLNIEDAFQLCLAEMEKKYNPQSGPTPTTTPRCICM